MYVVFRRSGKVVVSSDTLFPASNQDKIADCVDSSTVGAHWMGLLWQLAHPMWECFSISSRKL